MTLCAPKNACAKPQCYFSPGHVKPHIACTHLFASVTCSPIFTAFLCTEHEKITLLTKPPHTQSQIQGKGSKREIRSWELWTDHRLTCKAEEKQKDLSFFQTYQVPVSFLQATAGILLPILAAQHLCHTPALLSRALHPENPVLLLSTPFPPIYFPLASLICEVVGAEIICKHLESTWNIPSPTANK